jgi:hypothetical protein
MSVFHFSPFSPAFFVFFIKRLSRQESDEYQDQAAATPQILGKILIHGSESEALSLKT